MRDASDVRQKLKQAQFRHVKRVLRRQFAAIPSGGEWPREEVEKTKAEYREFFATRAIHEIAREFPDVAALLWVLEDRPDEPLAVNGTLVGSMGGILLWADTDEDAHNARDLIERLAAEAAGPPSRATKSLWERIFG